MAEHTDEARRERDFENRVARRREMPGEEPRGYNAFRRGFGEEEEEPRRRADERYDSYHPHPDDDPDEHGEPDHILHHKILQNRRVLDSLHHSHQHIYFDDLPNFRDAGLVNNRSEILDHRKMPDYTAPLHHGGFRNYHGITSGLHGFFDGMPDLSGPIFHGRMPDFSNIPRFGGSAQGKRKVRTRGRKGKTPRSEFDLEMFGGFR